MNNIPRILPYYLVNQPITMNQNFSLGWVPLYYIGYFVQAVWTGVPTGYFQLNASGDSFATGSNIVPPNGSPFYVPPGLINPVNSSMVLGSQYNVTSAGINGWNVNGSRYNFVQLAYVDSSGGTSTAQLTFANISQKGPS